MAKILIVDDELMICDLLKSVLSRRGHEVITTTDPGQAVDLFQQQRPAITLLDLFMPGTDGIGVLKAIRSIDPMAAVMMLTSGGSESMERQARLLGVTDFMRKGIALDTLMGVMERVLKRPSGTSPAPQAEPRAAAAMGGGHDGASVLVVDDEEMVRTLLKQYLTLKGYQVCLAKDGREALASLAEASPRMVILDMYMPGMNGVEVLRELRARDYAGGVVALTASQDEELLRQTLDLGSVDVLGKPVDLERLDLVLQVGLALTEPG